MLAYLNILNAQLALYLPTGNMKTNTQTYYPHINGLRALAVLSVIFFHLDFPIFQGGFVGVDVFLL